MDLPEYLNEVVARVWQETKPVSIFLYGSMARGDQVDGSDFEIGVVYKQETKVPRSELAKFHAFQNIKLYPFVIEELSEGIIDTPFPKAIYLETLRQESKTLWGKEIKEIIKEVEVTKDDLMESVGFSLGRAYCAVVSSRQKDMIAVQENFCKSIFYGLQVLLILNNRGVVGSYTKIVELSRELVPEEFNALIKSAIEVRRDISKIEIPKLYNAISFLNKVVLAQVRNR